MQPRVAAASRMRSRVIRLTPGFVVERAIDRPDRGADSARDVLHATAAGAAGRRRRWPGVIAGSLDGPGLGRVDGVGAAGRFRDEPHDLEDADAARVVPDDLRGLEHAPFTLDSSAMVTSGLASATGIEMRLRNEDTNFGSPLVSSGAMRRSLTITSGSPERPPKASGADGQCIRHGGTVCAFNRRRSTDVCRQVIYLKIGDEN